MLFLCWIVVELVLIHSWYVLEVVGIDCHWRYLIFLGSKEQNHFIYWLLSTFPIDSFLIDHFSASFFYNSAINSYTFWKITYAASSSYLTFLLVTPIQYFSWVEVHVIIYFCFIFPSFREVSFYHGLFFIFITFL